LRIQAEAQEKLVGRMRERRRCPPKIKTIRALLKTADIPAAEIAARFGVARPTPYGAIRNPAD